MQQIDLNVNPESSEIKSRHVTNCYVHSRSSRKFYLSFVLVCLSTSTSFASSVHDARNLNGADTDVVDHTQESGRSHVYIFSNITTQKEMTFRDEIDKADGLLDMHEDHAAMQAYWTIITRHSASPRSLWGLARTFLSLAKKHHSNKFLRRAITAMNETIKTPNIPKVLALNVAEQIMMASQFLGELSLTMPILRLLITTFPDKPEFLSGLAFTQLQNKRTIDAAKTTSLKVLSMDPNNNLALRILGSLAENSNDCERAIELFERLLELNGKTSSGVFLKLGYCYSKLGFTEKAMATFRQGADLGYFQSINQRPAVLTGRFLTSRPFWTAEQAGFERYKHLLESNWEIIKGEALSVFNTSFNLFKDDTGNLVENQQAGDWTKFTFYEQTKLFPGPCQKAPRTCAIVQQILPAVSCSRGQIKFSVLHGGVHVWPHTGPTDSRLRAHLGLVVPPGPVIRVVNETRTWEEGKLFIIDDSFEHEVWHNGTETRIVLIVDFWHPEVAHIERMTLYPT